MLRDHRRGVDQALSDPGQQHQRLSGTDDGYCIAVLDYELSTLAVGPVAGTPHAARGDVIVP